MLWLCVAPAKRSKGNRRLRSENNMLQKLNKSRFDLAHCSLFFQCVLQSLKVQARGAKDSESITLVGKYVFVALCSLSGLCDGALWPLNIDPRLS